MAVTYCGYHGVSWSGHQRSNKKELSVTSNRRSNVEFSANGSSFIYKWNESGCPLIMVSCLPYFSTYSRQHTLLFQMLSQDFGGFHNGGIFPEEQICEEYFHAYKFKDLILQSQPTPTNHQDNQLG